MKVVDKTLATDLSQPSLEQVEFIDSGDYRAYEEEPREWFDVVCYPRNRHGNESEKERDTLVTSSDDAVFSHSDDIPHYYSTILVGS